MKASMEKLVSSFARAIASGEKALYRTNEKIVRAIVDADRERSAETLSAMLPASGTQCVALARVFRQCLSGLEFEYDETGAPVSCDGEPELRKDANLSQFLHVAWWTVKPAKSKTQGAQGAQGAQGTKTQGKPDDVVAELGKVIGKVEKCIAGDRKAETGWSKAKLKTLLGVLRATKAVAESIKAGTYQPAAAPAQVADQPAAAPAQIADIRKAS